MTFPINKIISRLVEKRFLKIKSDGRLRFMYPKHFLALPIKELIIRYRSIMNGYANYFTFVNNKTKLSRVHWILRESLLKAIGSKKDLSRSEVVRRFGLDIVLKITKLREKKW